MLIQSCWYKYAQKDRLMEIFAIKIQEEIATKMGGMELEHLSFARIEVQRPTNQRNMGL